MKYIITKNCDLFLQINDLLIPYFFIYAIRSIYISFNDVKIRMKSKNGNGQTHKDFTLSFWINKLSYSNFCKHIFYKILSVFVTSRCI